MATNSDPIIYSFPEVNHSVLWCLLLTIHLGIVSRGDDLIKLPGIIIVSTVCARLELQGNDLPVPLSCRCQRRHHTRIAQRHIGLHNVILNNILPVLPHDLSEKSNSSANLFKGFYHNSWQHPHDLHHLHILLVYQANFLAFAIFLSAHYSGFL